MSPNSEAKRYTIDQAKDEAILMKSETSGEIGRKQAEAFLPMITNLTLLSEEKLREMAEMHEAAKAELVNKGINPNIVKKTIDIALHIKTNPSVLQEMRIDPTHARWLDIESVLLDEMKESNPHGYDLKIDQAVSVIELIQSIGQERFNTLIQKLNAIINELSEKKNALDDLDILHGVSLTNLAFIKLLSEAKDLSPTDVGNLSKLLQAEDRLKQLESLQKANK